MVNARAASASLRSVRVATVLTAARASTARRMPLCVVTRVERRPVNHAVVQNLVSMAPVSRRRVLAISAITMAVVSMKRNIVAPNA